MKNKIKLADLKVQSFVTNLESKQKEALKGAIKTIGICPTEIHSLCRTCQFVCE